jgi:hypothetical protein
LSLLRFSVQQQALRRMLRVSCRSILVGLGLAMALAGCSPGPMIDRLPADMGLPGGTPARPATPYQYPAVHDMPPARSTTTMTDEEQVKMEKDLAAVRDRQTAREGTAKTAVPATKKKPADAGSGQASGAKTNP